MSSAAAIRALPSSLALLDRIAARLVLGRLAGFRSALLWITLPDGARVDLGDPASQNRVAVSVLDWKFFRRALTASDIGVGESYMEGEWQASDLVELCRLYVLDHSLLDDPPRWALGSRARNFIFRLLRRPSLAGSAQNARHHYDLGNDFYRLFLDDSMTYSCAVFEPGETDLARAQRRKIEGICRRLALRPGLSVLEIGGGWGAFAIHAAREYGCRVVSLTLSQRQLALARERVREAGLDDRVEIRLSDYRQVRGEFDRIVSVEMFEAVGAQYFGTFFAACARLLKRSGRMFLQTITLPDARFDAYRRDLDFIRRYIFPGGCLPSLAEIARAVRDHSDLRISWTEDIGPHYARTLRLWRERFFARTAEVRALGFDDRFIRMWEFYLASCEGGFAAGFLGDLQMTLERPAARAARAID